MMAYRIYKLLKINKVDVFLGYTSKINIYGSLAARAAKVECINNITGLGSVFIRDSLLAGLVKILYKLSLQWSRLVFFQNQDDCDLFVEAGLIPPQRAHVLPGSGVDLNKYKPQLHTKNNKKFTFLLICRMMKDKGVFEYIEAASLLKKCNYDCVFQMLGPLDVDNPTAVKSSEILQYEQDGIVQYIGVVDDVRDFIARADCVVLPSYREGLPKVLLEAAAMGKPLIATNVAGCKNIVDHAINGYLCEVRNSRDLANKMLKIMTMPLTELKIMGMNSRKKVESGFSEEIVIDKYLDVINSINSHCNKSKNKVS